MGNFKYDFTESDNFNSPDLVENIEFNPAFHKSSRNYFQLTYPYQSLTGGALPEVKVFLNEWFKLDKENEKIDISNFVVNGIKSRNRYEVKYFNKIDYTMKTYFIDMNFRNGKGTSKQFSNLS